MADQRCRRTHVRGARFRKAYILKVQSKSSRGGNWYYEDLEVGPSIELFEDHSDCEASRRSHIHARADSAVIATRAHESNWLRARSNSCHSAHLRIQLSSIVTIMWLHYSHLSSSPSKHSPSILRDRTLLLCLRPCHETLSLTNSQACGAFSKLCKPITRLRDLAQWHLNAIGQPGLWKDTCP